MTATSSTPVTYCRISMDWIARVSALSVERNSLRVLQMGLVIQYINGRRALTGLDARSWSLLEIPDRSAYWAIRVLETAGLIIIERRPRKSPLVRPSFPTPGRGEARNETTPEATATAIVIERIPELVLAAGSGDRSETTLEVTATAAAVKSTSEPVSISSKKIYDSYFKKRVRDEIKSQMKAVGGRL